MAPQELCVKKGKLRVKKGEQLVTVVELSCNDPKCQGGCNLGLLELESVLSPRAAAEKTRDLLQKGEEHDARFHPKGEAVQTVTLFTNL